jgi:cell division protein ZapA
MKSIKVTILGKQYPIKVEDDEVETMERIAEFVNGRFEEYKKQIRNQPDSVVMALASLSIAEELFEERRINNEHQAQAPSPEQTSSDHDESEAADYLRQLKARLEDIKSELPS